MLAGAKGPRTGLACSGWSRPDAEDKGPPKGMACAAGSQPVSNSSLGWSPTFSGPLPFYIRPSFFTPLHLFRALLCSASLRFASSFHDDDSSIISIDRFRTLSGSSLTPPRGGVSDSGLFIYLFIYLFFFFLPE